MSVDEFWNSFCGYKDLLMDIDSAKEEDAESLLQRLDKDLKEYSEGVDFILGDLTEKGRTLTFTSEGDTDYFEPIIRLVEGSPVLDFWDIVAFKPAKGVNVSASFGNYRLNSKNMWFIPLENESEPERMGLRVALKEFNQEDEDLLIAVYSLIEQMLGEYDTATFVGYLELCPLPSETEKEDFIPLSELGNYAEWFISKTDKE